jgi:DNA-binding NarL/FixJ family response regulator
MVAEPVPFKARIPVYVSAADPLSRAGIVSQLRRAQGFAVVPEGELPDDVVALVVTDELDPTVLGEMRALRGRGVRRIVLLVSRVDDRSLLAAAEAGVTGVVRRSEATAGNLSAAIRSASAGEGTLPPDLLGRLLRQVGQLQRQVLSPRGLTFSGLTEREAAVLRLLAEGLDTAEVGQRLFYSERTVKNIIHDVTSRLELRNRSHAVAYAIREGLI